MHRKRIADIQPPKITLQEMPENKPQKQTETNVTEMACYRAESAVASLIIPYLIPHTEEKRMFIK